MTTRAKRLVATWSPTILPAILAAFLVRALGWSTGNWETWALMVSIGLLTGISITWHDYVVRDKAIQEAQSLLHHIMTNSTDKKERGI